MGGAHSKEEAPLPPNEMRLLVDNLEGAISEDGKTVDLRRVAQIMGLSERVALRFSPGKEHVTLNEFAAQVGRACCGSVEESVDFTFRLFDVSGTGTVTSKDIQEVLHDVALGALHSSAQVSHGAAQAVQPNEAFLKAVSEDAEFTSLFDSQDGDGTLGLSRTAFGKVAMTHSHLFLGLPRLIEHFLLRKRSQEEKRRRLSISTIDGEDTRFMFPTLYAGKLEIDPTTQLQNSLLSWEHIWLLASELPPEYTRRWTLFFNSGTHGTSFSQLCRFSLYRGPSLLVIEDTAGHVFGGFATGSWAPSPGHFVGDRRSFLFQLAPQIRFYRASGHNQNFQYMSKKATTFPNGLGFGGQIESMYFGVFIKDDIEHGISYPCSTYDSPSLASAERFKIRSIQIWGVTDGSVEPKYREMIEDMPDQSVLREENNADKTFLEISGTMSFSGEQNVPPEDERSGEQGLTGPIGRTGVSISRND